MKILYVILIIDIALLFWAHGEPLETNALFVPQWVKSVESNRVVHTRIDGDTNQPAFHVTLEQKAGVYGFYQLRFKPSIESSLWSTIAIGDDKGKHVAKIYVSTNSALYKTMIESNSGFFTTLPQYVRAGSKHRGTIYKLDMEGFFPQNTNNVATNATSSVSMGLPPFPDGG